MSVTPIPALRHELRVSEAPHQHDPGTRDVGGVPAGRGRLAGKAVARHRRDHHVEGVRRRPAVCRGIGQRIDDLQLLDDRAGPTVRDDQRQGIWEFRPNVDELNVEPVDRGHELREGIQPRLDTCASRSPSPSSARVSASSRAAPPATDSETVSRSGHRVASMRRFMSASTSSEKVEMEGPDGLGAALAVRLAVTGVPVPAPSGAGIIKTVTPMRDATRLSKRTSRSCLRFANANRAHRVLVPGTVGSLKSATGALGRVDSIDHLRQRYREARRKECKKGLRNHPASASDFAIFPTERGGHLARFVI